MSEFVRASYGGPNDDRTVTYHIACRNPEGLDRQRKAIGAAAGVLVEISTSIAVSFRENSASASTRASKLRKLLGILDQQQLLPFGEVEFRVGRDVILHWESHRRSAP